MSIGNLSAHYSRFSLLPSLFFSFPRIASLFCPALHWPACAHEPSKVNVSVREEPNAHSAPVYSILRSSWLFTDRCLCAESEMHLHDSLSKRRHDSNKRDGLIKALGSQPKKASDQGTTRFPLVCSERQHHPTMLCVSSLRSICMLILSSCSLFTAPRQPRRRTGSNAHLHGPNASARKRTPAPPTADGPHVRTRGRPFEDVQLANHEASRAPDRLIPPVVYDGRGTRLVHGHHGARGRHGMHRGCRDRDWRALQQSDPDPA